MDHPPAAQRYQRRFFAFEEVAPLLLNQLRKAFYALRASAAQDDLIPSDPRVAGDEALYSLVWAGNRQHMAATEDRPEETKPLFVETWKRLSERDRNAHIPDLSDWVDFQPWLTLTDAGVAMFIEPDAETCFGQAFRCRKHALGAITVPATHDGYSPLYLRLSLHRPKRGEHTLGC